MRKLYLLLAACFLVFGSYGQTTVTIYAGTGGLPTTTYITGYASNGSTGFGPPAYARHPDTIIAASGFGTSDRGYAVFNLSPIPAGAIIENCVVGFNVVSNTGGSPTGGWQTFGYSGDLSSVTTAATLYADCETGSLISSTAYVTSGNQVIGSSTASIALVSANIGNKVSVCFTDTSTGFGGVSTYNITGADGTATTTGTHTPYLQVIYCLPITGPKSTCIDGTITLADDTDGVWSVAGSGASVATVNSSSGVVTGLSDGTAIITFTKGSCVVHDTVTIAALPPITGTPTVCTGVTTALADAGSGGVWSSSVTSIATVSSAGVVTGVAPGLTTISYTTYNGTTLSCESLLTVNVSPSPGPIIGNTTICLGSADTLTDAVPGGSWTSDVTTVATINTITGVISIVGTGATDIIYTTGPACEATAVLNITDAPTAISPAGAVSICEGASASLTDGVSGGSWTSSNTNIATVSSTGGVFGVAAGTATITYAIGTCMVTKIVTVNGPGPISPSSATICSGSTFTFTDTTSGGTWSSSSTTVASVTGGVVTGLGSGTATISYNFGGCAATSTVTVNSAATSITPATATICIGTTTTLTDGASGGVWTSSNTGVATVSGGTVTGVAAGTVTIGYAIGTCAASATVTVAASPSAIAPAATVGVCAGGSTNLTDLTGGGVWSTGSTAIATVSTTGTVTGIALGTVTISYTVSGCSVTKVLNVTAGPGAISPSPASVCVGTTTILTNPTGGGVWSPSNPTIATVTSGGVVTGVALGTATISYSLGSCSATVPITVVNPPDGIVGAAAFCSGTNITLTDGTSGGTWSSGSTAIATVTGGVVTGLSAGTATISYSVGACPVTTIVTVTPGPALISPAATTACTGVPVTLSESAGGGVWTSGNTAIATVSATGDVTGVAAGVDTVSYTLSSCTTTAIVTVNLSANAGVISGPDIECVGSSALVLTDAVSGGVWTSSNTGVAAVSGGTVTGISAGTAIISYTVSGVGSCGSAVATYPVSINVSPVGGTITGLSMICAGTFTTLVDGVAGGTWSRSNTSASISSTGLLTGITPGVDTITYNIVSVCGTASAPQFVVTIGPFLTAGVIAGPTSVCSGSAITLTNPASGGVWSSFNPAIAGVSGTGVVTGGTPGIDTIYYTVTISCGTAVASYVVTVNPTIPAAGTITGGTAGICVGSTVTLADAVSGGVWSASNTHGSISASGIVIGNTAGLDTIKYTVTSACGIGSTSTVITISTAPVAGTISGSGVVCQGASTTLTDATSGGVWTASNSNASVNPATGMVTGVSPGTDVITYTVTNPCGTATATFSITVNPVGAAGAITGTDTVCVATTVVFSDPLPGGVWTSGSTGIATVSSGGVVTGVSTGTAPITYSVTTSCGSALSVRTVHVMAIPSVSPISGISIVCIGSGITLTDPTPGGTWLASNPNASVAAPGIIDGITIGVDTIFYEIASGCGPGTAFKVVSVDPVPVVTPISGPGKQCLSTLVALTDATVGGVWTSNHPTIASVDLSSGEAFGATAGVATISYTVTNSFGCPTSVTIPDTVLVTPVLSGITGSTSVCAGANVTLSNSTAAGVWTSSNTAIGIVDPATGIVTGISTGTFTVTYTVTNICGSDYVTRAETVNPIPTVSGITGTASECIGTSSLLSDATTGGTWSSSDTTIATVNTTTGVVTGVAAGGAIIYYTYTGGPYGCSNSVDIADLVNPLPIIAPITGVLHECIGAATPLADATPSGIWSSGDPLKATVSASGVVTGVSGGSVTISYSVSGGGCTGSATATDSILAAPSAAPITGATSACVGSGTTLTDAVPFGAWSSANTAVAVVDATTGIVTGITTGLVEVYYTVSNGCGAAVTDSTNLIVFGAPSAGAVSASFTTVCAGSTVDLTESVAGGTWSSANTAVATVGSTGIVTGVASGSVLINYTTTSTTGCSGVSSITLTIGGAISSAAISPAGGHASICHGHSVAMYVSASGTGITYQWQDNGIAIPGATDTSYTATTTGNYSVVLSSATCSETIAGPDVVNIIAPIISFISPDVLYTGSYYLYRWYKNGTLVPGATTGLFHETGPGTYMVVVTDNGGCADTAQYTVNGGGTTNFVQNTVTAGEIKVYPNPASTTLHIDAAVKVNVALLSIDGKTLINQKDATNIDVSHLADGLYIIMIYDENNLLLKTAKFAKVE